MKKIVVSALCTLLLTACGGKGGTAVDSDSVNVADMATPEETVVRVAYITKDSIGDIHIGMSLNEIPDSVAGLYSRKVAGASQDAVTVSFFSGDDERFIAYDFGENQIDVLNLISPDVKVKAPRGEFGLGDKFSKVLELPGVKEEWSGYDDSGMWYWTWEGLWFAPSQENLPAVLARRLYHSGDEPTRADFTDEVTIGFIGTGLPF